MYGGQSGEFASVYWCLKSIEPCIILGSPLKEECTVFTLTFILSVYASSPLLSRIAFFFRLIRVNKICPLQYTDIVVEFLAVTNKYSSFKNLFVGLWFWVVKIVSWWTTVKIVFRRNCSKTSLCPYLFVQLSETLEQTRHNFIICVILLSG